MQATMPTSNTYTLPNGLTVQQHLSYETDFVYREVFIDHIYTRPFPDLPPNPCVIDVGANIGLFSLFIKQQFPHARIYAFEPAPVHFHLLQQNLATYTDVHLFPQGLGEKQTRKMLTYYPNYSLLSGFHGDAEQDRRLLSAGIAEQLQRDTNHDKNDAGNYVELLIGDKLDKPEQIPCDITTLSALLEQENISHVDLLKIDAEKAEEDVLRGLVQADWAKIHRLVIEIHHTEACDSICARLKQQGYQIDAKKTADFNNAAIYTVCARRREKPHP